MRLLAIGRVLLQFFPLSVFLRVAWYNGTPQPEDWLNAFMFGAAAAVFQLVLSSVLARGHPLNRLILGVNLYLILAGAAVLTNQIVVLQTLRDLKESAIFLCLLAVGLCTTFASSAGFVGAAKGAAPRAVRNYSLYLLLLTCAGLAASFGLRGQWLVSAVLPLIALSLASRWFKWRLQRAVDPTDAALPPQSRDEMPSHTQQKSGQ